MPAVRAMISASPTCSGVLVRQAFLRMIGLPAVVAMLAIGLITAPALGENHVVRDPRGDAPARIDIRSATLHNGANTVAALIRVDNVLRRPALFALWFRPANTPHIISFIARTVRREDGSIVNRLYFFNARGERRQVPCDLRVVWRYSADTVRISVPRACTRGITGRLWMGARGYITGPGDRDLTLSSWVLQG